MKRWMWILAVAAFMTGCAKQGKESKDIPVVQEIKELEPAEEPQEDDLHSRMIKEQTFKIELDGWGDVTFASIAPDGIRDQDVSFRLFRGEEEVYTFPDQEEEGFQSVLAVSFQDYNEDGRTDVIVIVQYQDEKNSWNRAKVFLQENPEDTFYRDYHLEESALLKGESGEGPSFYRDLLLEEYLGKQNLTDSISSVMGSWTAYTEYVEETWEIFESDSQIMAFAKQAGQWGPDVDYADEQYCFALTDLNLDGRLELMVSNFGGTGMFSYNHFYTVDKDGKLQELRQDVEETEGESQADIIVEEAAVYRAASEEESVLYYIFGDFMKASPAEYYEDICAMSFSEDQVTELLLASKYTTYSGEDFAAQEVYLDGSGKEITEEAYLDCARAYFEGQGMEKKTACFGWTDVRELQGLSTEEVALALTESYKKFRVQ